MLRFQRFLVKFWLALAILSVAFSAYILSTRGWDEGAWSLMMPVIAGAWWMVRRFMLKRIENILAAEEARKEKEASSAKK